MVTTVQVSDGEDAEQSPLVISDHARAWTFLSNHAHVLVAISNTPDIRLREVAMRVGITERSASGIVADLEAAGYLKRIRVGRTNRYEVHGDLYLRHPLEAHRTIGEVLTLLAKQG
jgi:DNA-binding transcriptional ArsR family regulator